MSKTQREILVEALNVAADQILILANALNTKAKNSVDCDGSLSARCRSVTATKLYNIVDQLDSSRILLKHNILTSI